MQRLLPPRLFLICVALTVVLGLLVPIGGQLPTALRLLSVPIFLAGAWVVMGSSRHFGRVGTNIVTSDDPDQLVNDRHFRWSRNPMYLGFLTMLVAVAAGVGTASAWVGPVLFFVVASCWYIPFEEGRMQAVFGEEYDAYRATVRRWAGRRSPRSAT